MSSAEPREQRQSQAVPESPSEQQHPSTRSRYASAEGKEGKESPAPTAPVNQRHKRNDSAVSTGLSSGDEAYGATSSRKHDYDVHSMETNISARNSMTKNPIPAPNVTIRSEFPTLTRSRVQQTLTCLITVEVPEGKWKPDPSDIRGVAPVHHRQASVPAEETQANTGASNTPQLDHEPFVPYDSPEVLEDITEDLRLRVDNWHGLDFQRFGKLRLFNTIRVGKDRQSWQELECFLFAEMLICVKEKKNAAPHWDGSSQRKLTRCTLKGSILIKKHLKQVTEASGGM